VHIDSLGLARPAWLKAATVGYLCRPGRGISWRPPTYSLLKLRCNYILTT